MQRTTPVALTRRPHPVEARRGLALTPVERGLRPGFAEALTTEDARAMLAEASRVWAERNAGRKRPLLTPADGNQKLALGLAFVPSVSLTLAPARYSGANLCPMSTPMCRADCLQFGGRFMFTVPQAARIRRSRFMIDEPALFMAVLTRELSRWQAYYARKGRVTEALALMACRLNALSDIRWELVAPELFARYPGIAFYDYTKHAPEARRELGNYDLTYSISERHRLADVDALVAQGHRCAMLMAPGSPLRTTDRWPLIDGDAHDLRFTERKGAVVMLKPKGRAKRITPAPERSFVR